MRVKQIAVGIVASIVVATALSPVSRLFSPAGLLVVTGAGFLGFGFSEIALDFLGDLRSAGGRRELLEIRGGFGLQRGPGEKAAEESWLKAEEHEHHKHLIDSFFAQLKGLRVAPSLREPFHLDLFTLTPPPQGFQLPIDASLSSLPVREEAVRHLAAAEYGPVRRAFDSLVGSVTAFNARADEVISTIDLEGKMRRVIPDLRNESEARPLTWENYYYSRNLWLALEKVVANPEVASQISESGADLEQMMPWAAGYKLVVGGYTVAHTKEARDVEALQRLIIDSSRNLKELIAEREIAQSGLEVPLAAFTEELRKFLEDFNVHQRLSGRCHVEESLEEQAGFDRTRQ
jgi:hypothetical protein